MRMDFIAIDGADVMKTLFPWLGLIVIVVWVATLLIGLTMMWDPAWMSAESDPPAEVATGVLHFAAVMAGIGLGLSLFLKTVRHRLHGLQIASFAVAFVLGLVTLSRLF